MASLRDKIAQFGPGLLYAGAAVGVSHLVQSTRAGAEFGFQLLWVVIVINLIKYPIFEIGPRYAAATGVTLLDGYRKIGRWAVFTYMALSMSTMFIVMGAISLVTAGLFVQFSGFEIDARIVAVLLLALSVLLLGFGRYTTLDRFMKIIIVLLTISTIIAVVLASIEPTVKIESFKNNFDFSNELNVFFLVALIGWMPAPVDISIWHSVWSISKMKERGGSIDLKSSLNDFKLGYWGTTLLAAGFLSLGALVLYGFGTELAEGSIGFSAQLIGMYTNNIGQWAFPFIALAAFTTMFSTLLTCLDAFPRTLRKSTKLISTALSARSHHQNLYWFWIITTAFGTSVILLFFSSSMLSLVDLATTISFVVAPILALLNWKAMNDAIISDALKQPKYLRIAHVVSIGLLTAFSLWFLYTKIAVYL